MTAFCNRSIGSLMTDVGMIFEFAINLCYIYKEFCLYFLYRTIKLKDYLLQSSIKLYFNIINEEKF